MRLYPIEAGHFKLDGGAMFGVVPQSIWQRTNPPDQNNLIDLATRCLLVEDGNRLTLIDTGMGDKQPESFWKHYHLFGDNNLMGSIKKAGFAPEDITDVLLTHLHFDHCGGAVNRAPSGTLEPAFKNARYWVHRAHWDWALAPNAREKASFLSENILPLLESGQLRFLDQTNLSPGSLGAPVFQTPLGFEVFIADGHTEKQLLPLIPMADGICAYGADLIPTLGHIPLAYVMGYDVRPLQTLTEKELFLKWAVKHEWKLFFEHDPSCQGCTLRDTEKGVRSDKLITFNEL